jgi:hypothetical protein
MDVEFVNKEVGGTSVCGRRTQKYFRIGKVYEVAEFLEFINDCDADKGFDFRNFMKAAFAGDYEVSSFSLRYLVFEKSQRCATCGLTASFLALEYNDLSNRSKTKSAHFNLYGVNDRGQEVMFTKDHIYPKSKGGSNDLSNLQTMCTCCNFKKANKVV